MSKVDKLLDQTEDKVINIVINGLLEEIVTGNGVEDVNGDLVIQMPTKTIRKLRKTLREYKDA